MPDQNEIAAQVVRFLRRLARHIEENPESLKGMEIATHDIPKLTKGRSKAKKLDFDLFQILSEGGEDGLRRKLEPLGLHDLKGIISKHGFDTSKLAEKWRTKDRLINLIVDRAKARSDKGNVFKAYGEDIPPNP